jgi:predicted ATPase
MARLDRLATVKSLAQLGATLGREFAYDLLHAVSPWDEGTLQRGLHQLVEAEFLYQRGVPPQATYTFKHALIQDVAYQSLLRRTRQQHHQRIAQALEAQFTETVATQPELVAQHYTAAGCAEQAIPYWRRAGQQASERSAYAEAVSHLTIVLDLLSTLPETRERSQQELAVQMTLGMVLVATKGFAAPEVAYAYTRAHALCREVRDTPQLGSALIGLYGFHVVRAEFQTAQELAEQYLTLAHSRQDPALLGVAHRVLGQTTFWRGELVPARAHLQQSITLYNPEQRRSQALSMGQDPGVTGGAWLALTLWLLGSPDQARQWSHEALTLAQELSHPFTLVVALILSAWLHHFLYERHAAQEQAEAAIRLASEQGFAHWVAWGTILRGAALAEQGQRAEGLVQIRQGLDAYRATGGEAARPYWLALLAQACQKAGQPEEGLTLLTEALATAHKTGEGWWEAEIYRLRGELLSQHAVAQPGEAETWLQQALDVARRQEAKSLELRAAMSLGRLWQQQGKHAEAYELLAPVYGWFTEGFDTADLQEAKALLEELAG